MKIRKLRNILLLGGIMSTCFAAGVYAQDAITKVEAYLRSDFKVVVNGQQIDLEYPPLIYRDSSYLPLKELAGYLGANINWNGDTKTIYINSKIYSNQPVGNVESNFEQIQMIGPISSYVQYLGGKYPLLINRDYKKTYYRLTDVQRMGIDTSGLQKAKEKFTGALYVSEDELKKKWKETPKVTYNSTDTIVISGETNDKKIEALKNYLTNMSSYNPAQTQNFHYITPIIIDALPKDDEYDMLFLDNNHYFVMHIRLWNPSDNVYSISSTSQEDIEAKAN